MTTTPPPIEVDDATWRRSLIAVDQAFGRMPYGAGAMFASLYRSRGDAGLSPEEALATIADNLDRLTNVLRGAAANSQENQTELYNLRHYLAGAGELGARMVALAEEANNVEAGPEAGTITRQREALEAIVALGRAEHERYMMDALLHNIVDVAALALVVGTPAAEPQEPGT